MRTLTLFVKNFYEFCVGDGVFIDIVVSIKGFNLFHRLV